MATFAWWDSLMLPDLSGFRHNLVLRKALDNRTAKTNSPATRATPPRSLLDQRPGKEP